MEDEMKPLLFCAHEGDICAGQALSILERAGYDVRLLSDGQTAPPSAVAVFSLARGVVMPGVHLRLAAYYLEEEAPQWARNTPFLVGVKDMNLGDPKTRRRPEAILDMARRYEAWLPGVQSTGRTPWWPNPNDTGPMRLQYPRLFEVWAKKAREAVETTLADILTGNLETVFGGTQAIHRAQEHGKPRLLITFCAVFNKPHTDIAERIESAKAAAVRSSLIRLLDDVAPWISEAIFIIPGRDFIDEPLRQTLHPFFWPSLEELERALGQRLRGRLWGKNGRRSDQEVAAALDYGYDLFLREIALPVKNSTQVKVSFTTWTEFFGQDLINQAWEIAKAHREVAERIYRGRVQTREWYRTVARVDKMAGSQSGLARTIANNAAYLVSALHSANHPGDLEIDFEVDRQFWDELSHVLSENWGDNEPYIGIAPASCRQPWAY
jgi:hypothetical protein